MEYEIDVCRHFYSLQITMHVLINNVTNPNLLKRSLKITSRRDTHHGIRSDFHRHQDLNFLAASLSKQSGAKPSHVKTQSAKPSPEKYQHQNRDPRVSLY